MCDLSHELIDPRLGIIELVAETYRDAGAPNFFHFWAKTCDIGAFSHQRNALYTGGAAVNRGNAMAKAIGEAVERYCAALFDTEELPLASYSDAAFPCVPPEEFALWTPGQYKSPGFAYLPFTRHTPVRWTRALDLESGHDCFVPAVFIYVPYYFAQEAADTPIAQPISTGLACQSNQYSAAVAAIYEVIERDAFTITWQARLSRPRISLETLSPANRAIAVRFERAGYGLSLLDITMDTGVPTLLAVLEGRSMDVPPLVVAAATSLDPEVAARKALEELEHSRTAFQRIQKTVQRLDATPTHQTVVDQESHLNFWCDPAHIPSAKFLTASADVVDFGSVKGAATGSSVQDLTLLSERVSALGHRILLADVTTADVGALGLAVVRAVIPGFHPLVIGHRYRALGGRRLWELPQKLGYSGVDPTSGDNPYPHPYP